MPNKEIEYKKAELNDIHQVQKLLNKYQLPFEDVIDSDVFLIVALANRQVIGCIGIEKKGDSGLLRSFVVDERFQKQGLGNELFKRLFDEIRKDKTKVVHLLTTTAEEYFRKKGFVTTDRNEAPKNIKATTGFSTICPSSAIYMTLEIDKTKN